MQASLFSEPFAPFPNVPKNPQHVAVAGWSTLWYETRGVEWRWVPKDHFQIRNALKFCAGGDPEVWLERARRLLLEPPSAWYAQNASPTLVYSRWNELAVRARPMTMDQKNALSLAQAARSL